MQEHDVLAEIRAVRDDLARRHGGDAEALSRMLAERTQAAGRVAVRFPPRPPRPTRVVGQPAVARSVPQGADASIPNPALLPTAAEHSC